MKIKREDFLKILNIAAVGLTRREILEQSNSFVFTEDYLVTFNGEVLTKCKNPLDDVTGAVGAEDLTKLLSKFPDEFIEVIDKGDELRIKAGGRRSAGITKAAEVALPFDDVPAPKKWNPIPETLLSVLHQAARVCGQDETQPRTTEVHVTEDKVEACDNFRLFRYTMDTGFKKELLIPALSVAGLAGLVFTHCSTRGGWVHFKTESDHVVSLRCSQGEYPDISPLLEMGKKTEKVTLPSNLADILGRAEVMHETSYDAVVSVTIKEGELTLKASKEGGWYKETKRVKYSGRPLQFQVHPKFLEDVLQKTHKVLIGGDRLKLEAGDAVFIVCLEVTD